MKLVIDLQGAQSASRHRGIGRYSLALAEALLRRAGHHEVWIALNGTLHETIEPLRGFFDGLIPQERIVVWDAPTPVAEFNAATQWRRETGEILREAFLSSLKPDIVHVSSLFEGYGDDVVTSVGTLIDGSRTAVTLYDLIPLIHEKTFLVDPVLKAWYYRKMSSMRRAGLWLAISESSRREGIDWLNLPSEKVVNISAAAHPRFRPLELGESQIQTVLRQYDITRPFILYAGSTDPHKNLVGLLQAYGALDLAIRHAHQLVIVCPAQAADIAPLHESARQAGLGEGEVVFARFVPDDDLVVLYNLAKVFCLPSKHEGFGLPALEAMQCGTATIGSNRSSIPEVIGRNDALFDPYDPKDISARLHNVLVDDSYRENLIEHGLAHARKFSWDESARRTWEAFEANFDPASPRSIHHTGTASIQQATFSQRPRLAYVSSLLSESSQISEFASKLLPELNNYYDIDVFSNQTSIADQRLHGSRSTESIEVFERKAHRYDRIVYQLGDAGHDLQLRSLAERYPGVIAVDTLSFDSTLSGGARQVGSAVSVGDELYYSCGYHALSELMQSEGRGRLMAEWSAAVSVLRNAVGVIFNGNRIRHIAVAALDGTLPQEHVTLPRPASISVEENRASARGTLGISESDFVVCVLIGSACENSAERLHKACETLGWAERADCHIVVVDERLGHSDQDPFTFASQVYRHEHAEPVAREEYIVASDVAVVLGSVSFNENWAFTVECMSLAVPTIVVGDSGRLGEVTDGVIGLAPMFTDKELCAALENLQASRDRKALGRNAQARAKDLLSPRALARQCYDAIETFWQTSCAGLKLGTVNALAAVDPNHDDEQDWLALARSVARSLPTPSGKRQLLIDISELVHRDAKTGIQRVTRSVLAELLAHPPAGFRVEPVYAKSEQLGYSYAREFTTKFLNCPRGSLRDAPLETRPGDVFLGLDLQHHVVVSQKDVLADMRQRGVEIHFVVYDLLPILLPHAFVEGSADWHTRWLSTLQTTADGIVCISRSVADELISWFNENPKPRERPIRIGWFHLGSDIEMSSPTRGFPDQAVETLAALANRPSFLSVGTIEPRKGHAQTLAAFEELWASGLDINLIVVGKQGWHVEDLIDTLRNHPELNKRLFWLEGISDEYLEKIYAASACLIAASEGEGFGLPLIEAARHKIPILARDIPVFREVAGTHASYFSGIEPSSLASAIKVWLNLYAEARHPQSADMRWLTWVESVDQLMTNVLQGKWYKVWRPEDRGPNSKPQPVGMRHVMLAKQDA